MYVSVWIETSVAILITIVKKMMMVRVRMKLVTAVTIKIK